MINMKISNKKKMRNSLFVVGIILILLMVRIWYIQFVQGAFLVEKATAQQSLGRSITAKRGTIYDSSKKYILAMSASVESVTVNPTQISKQDKEMVAQALSEIFELNYEKIQQYDVNDIYKILMTNFQKIYEQYSYLGLSKEEYDTIIRQIDDAYHIRYIDKSIGYIQSREYLASYAFEIHGYNEDNIFRKDEDL